MANEEIRIDGSRTDIMKTDERVIVDGVDGDGPAAGGGFVGPLTKERVYAGRYLIQGKDSNAGKVYLSSNADGSKRLPIVAFNDAARSDRNVDLSTLYVVVENDTEGVDFIYNSTGKQP